MTKPKLLNPGRGFVAAYDFSISGLTLTPGCVLRCSYCYSPTILHKSLEQFGQDGKLVKLSFDKWESLVKSEVDKASGKTVYMNVMTDPYQPHTRKYTRHLLEAFLEHRPSKLVVQTRSPLAAQDIDVMQKFGETIRLNVTIDTNDDAVRKHFSPTAPGLEARWRMIESASNVGIPVCVTCTPTLPFTRKRSEVLQWCDRINSLPTVSHVVVQEFHDGRLTKTSPEGLEVSENYDWFFEQGGYMRLVALLQSNLRVPVMDGKPGFGPWAPN
ncbi:MAG: radical SAM protein [Armatimonadetes bacterium]|nr:radical SAM protein [Armatimonadota bacterium]